MKRSLTELRAAMHYVLLHGTDAELLAFRDEYRNLCPARGTARRSRQMGNELNLTSEFREALGKQLHRQLEVAMPWEDMGISDRFQFKLAAESLFRVGVAHPRVDAIPERQDGHCRSDKCLRKPVDYAHHKYSQCDCCCSECIAADYDDPKPTNRGDK